MSRTPHWPCISCRSQPMRCSLQFGFLPNIALVRFPMSAFPSMRNSADGFTQLIEEFLMMDTNDAAELSQALVDHGVAEVGRIDTYAGHIESHGEVTFQVKDLGGSPRWSVQVFNEAGVWMG